MSATYDLEQRTREVEALLRSKGIEPSTIGPSFIKKCLYFADGEAKRSEAICKKLMNFRAGVGWPLRLRTSDVEANALRSGLYSLLTDREGRIVFVLDFSRLAEASSALLGERAANGTESRFELLQKLGMYVMEQVTDKPESMRRGVVFLVDCRGASQDAFSGVGLADAKRGSKMWAGFPVKLKRVLVIGLSPIMSAVVRGLMWTSVSSKMRHRVSFLPSLNFSSDGGPAILDTEIGFHFLPRSLGGTLTNLPITDFG
jgi:hypothetical protein